MGSHYCVCIRTRRVHFLWIIHGSPVEGRLNWDVVVLSRVLGGSRALGRKLFVVPNIGAGTREMRAMMVWGLSLCLATAWVQGISLFWRVGHGSCRPLPASRAEAWNVQGVAHVVTGPCPGGAAALPWVYYCVYCFLPGFGLWGIVDAQYVLNTSSTSLIISHACLRWTWLFGACWTALYVVGVSLFCEAGSAVSGLVTRQLWWPWLACLAAAWEAFEFVYCILDGATRGRCLVVLWGRGALCQWAGFRYKAVVVAVGCMPGFGLGGIWMCTYIHVYYIDFVSSMYGHWYWRAVVRGPSFWISRAGESGGVVHVAWSLGSWEAGVASECRLCWCLHTGTWCTWGIDQLSCVYFSLYWDLSSRCFGPGMTS